MKKYPVLHAREKKDLQPHHPWKGDFILPFFSSLRVIEDPDCHYPWFSDISLLSLPHLRYIAIFWDRGVRKETGCLFPDGIWSPFKPITRRSLSTLTFLHRLELRVSSWYSNDEEPGEDAIDWETITSLKNLRFLAIPALPNLIKGLTAEVLIGHVSQLPSLVALEIGLGRRSMEPRYTIEKTSELGPDGHMKFLVNDLILFAEKQSWLSFEKEGKQLTGRAYLDRLIHYSMHSKVQIIRIAKQKGNDSVINQ